MFHARLKRRRRGRLFAALAATVLLALGCTGDSVSSPPAATTAGAAAITSTRSPLATATGPSSSLNPSVPALCRQGVPSALARLTAADFTEISGMVASRKQQVVWVHNDGGDGAILFAVDLQGAIRSRVQITNAENTDWEDVAIGPGESGVDYLYVGDIGDNAEKRSSIIVYRLAEPAPTENRVRAEAMVLHYPDRPHDAESLLVDPRTSEVLILTKERNGRSMLFRAPPFRAEGNLELVTTIDVRPDLVSAADYTPDGSAIAVRTYASIRLYTAAPGSRPSLDAEPCLVAPPPEKQGESITFSADGTSIYTVSEGKNPTLYIIKA